MQSPLNSGEGLSTGYALLLSQGLQVWGEGSVTSGKQGHCTRERVNKNLEEIVFIPALERHNEKLNEHRETP
jgi:hypothetical protein